MKTFTDIKTWLTSKPNEQEITKVLELINRGAKRELKHELWLKEKELRKALKFADEMKELGYKPTQEMITKTTSISNEVKALQEQIGPVVKRVKKNPPVKKEEKTIDFPGKLTEE